MAFTALKGRSSTVLHTRQFFRSLWIARPERQVKSSFSARLLKPCPSTTLPIPTFLRNRWSCALPESHLWNQP